MEDLAVVLPARRLCFGHDMTHQILAHLLTPTSSQTFVAIRDAALRIDGDGRIEAILSPNESGIPSGIETQDLRPHWILPGMVDAHVHLPQYPAVARDGLELLPWLENFIFPAEARFSDPCEARRAARRFFQDQLASGTTTTVSYLTIHAEAAEACFQEAEACGIRAVLGKMMMDRHSPENLSEATERSLKESEALCRTWHGRDRGRIRYAMTPRFAPTCSPELMKGAAKLAERHQAYIQTHLSENLEELAWVRELFPDCANYTEVYDRFSLLGPRTLLGHGIHLSPAERSLLKERKCSLVHCPSSNIFLKSGIMPLIRNLDEGLSVALGTDVGAGPNLCLFREMSALLSAGKLRWAMQKLASARLEEGVSDVEQRAQLKILLDIEPDPRVPDPALALYLATLGGAMALGMEQEIGSLETGKDADFIVVDSTRLHPEGHVVEDPEQLLAYLGYRGEAMALAGTYVRGQRRA